MPVKLPVGSSGKSRTLDFARVLTGMSDPEDYGT